MSRTGGTKLSKAFTLVEILLVIIIIGIVFALAVPNFSKGYSRFELTKTADDLLSVSRWAQAMAIGQQRIYALIISADHRSYGLVRERSDDGINGQIAEDAGGQDKFEPVKGTLGKMHTVPDKVTLDPLNDRITFYPDGTIDPSAIRLASSGKQIELSSTAVRGMMTKVSDE